MLSNIIKFFRKQVFVSAFLVAGTLLAIKLVVIPDSLEFIEPISIYTALLSSVIFIYGFMIAPAVAEYKESERLRVELKSTIENIMLDVDYFTLLKQELNPTIFRKNFGNLLSYVFGRIADDTRGKSLNELMKGTNDYLYEAEAGGIPANHIIKLKQEFSTLRKIIGRILQIRDHESLPMVVHNLRIFITIFIIATLMFLNIGNTSQDTLVWEIKEWIVIFILSFIYTYLSFIISSLENPFDKRNFSGYIDMSFLKKYAKEVEMHGQTGDVI